MWRSNIAAKTLNYIRRACRHKFRAFAPKVTDLFIQCKRGRNNIFDDSHSSEREWALPREKAQEKSMLLWRDLDEIWGRLATPLESPIHGGVTGIKATMIFGYTIPAIKCLAVREHF